MLTMCSVELCPGTSSSSYKGAGFLDPSPALRTYLTFTPRHKSCISVLMGLHHEFGWVI